MHPIINPFHPEDLALLYREQVFESEIEQKKFERHQSRMNQLALSTLRSGFFKRIMRNDLAPPPRPDVTDFICQMYGWRDHLNAYQHIYISFEEFRKHPQYREMAEIARTALRIIEGRADLEVWLENIFDPLDLQEPSPKLLEKLEFDPSKLLNVSIPFETDFKSCKLRPL